MPLSKQLLALCLIIPTLLTSAVFGLPVDSSTSAVAHARTLLATASSTLIPVQTTPLGASCNSASICEKASSCLQLTFFPVMSNPACGGYGASCGANTECAFNTCANGFCTGALPSTTTIKSVAPTPTGTTPLGSPCTSSTQCVNGAFCFAPHDQTIAHPVCGGFQGPCKSDKQCASNYCSGGSCDF